MSELNARYYEYKFKPDNDYYNDLYRKRYNEGYGDRVFDTGYTFSKEKEELEVIFSATPLRGYAGEDKIYPTIFKRTGNEPTAIEEAQDCNIRILFAKEIPDVAAWSIKDGSTVLQTLTSYGYAGHFDDPENPASDLNFGATKELFFTLAVASSNISANQFNVFWSPYMAEITDKDSMLVTAKAYLTTKDIYSLNWRKYVFVDGILFRLNKIIDYNANEPITCTIELLKVLCTDYSSTTPTIPTVSPEEFLIVYTANGEEGSALTIPEIQGKKVLLVARQNSFLIPQNFFMPYLNDISLLYTPKPSLSKITLGLPPVAGEVFQILYST